MRSQVTYRFSDKILTIVPIKNNKIDGIVEIKINDNLKHLKFKDGKLSGINHHQGFEFQDNNLILNGNIIEPENNSWLLLETNELLSFNGESFDLIKKPIKFPRDGPYKDQLRTIHFKDGKHDERSNFIQIINGKKFTFLIKDNKVVRCNDLLLENGFSEDYEMIFTYDPEKFQIKYKPSKYPITGKYYKDNRWINFFEGKVSMKDRKNYSFHQEIEGRTWYFKIDDNKILSVYDGKHPYPVQEDGNCYQLGKKFIFDTTNFHIKVKYMKESSVKEVRENGYILYFFVNGLITRKEYYYDEKLKKIKYVN